MKGIVIALALLYVVCVVASDPLPVMAKAINLDSNAKLIVNTTMLATSGDWLKLFWNVTNATKDDLIFVYSPANVNFTMTSPIKYKAVGDSSHTSDTGSHGGSVTNAGDSDFRLVNMRANYIFAYLQNETIVALSQVVEFMNYNEPLQGHLALTGVAGEMSITWVTRDAELPQVKWGRVSQTYLTIASARTNTYKASDLCGSVAATLGWKDPGSINSAVMKGLVPNQTYYYIFGDSKFGWSDEYSFVAPPRPAKNSTVNIIAYGDMGKHDPDGSSEHWMEPGAAKTLDGIKQELETNQYDLAVHIGDLAYAVGYSAQWDLFFDRITPVATKLPYMVCPGNHEFDFEDHFLLNVSDSYGECGVPYMHRFKMPNVRNTSDPFYSFNIGPVHIVLMSTENNFTVGSVQHKFLEQDLASVDRSVTPWVIFTGHRPMYIDSTNNGSLASDQNVAKWLRTNVEPLLYKYKVDLAWWGHHHSYQRTCTVFNEQCVSDGTTHVVIGMAGASLSQNLLPTKPDWFEFVDDANWGFTKLSIDGKTLRMQYIRNGGEVADDFKLKARL